MSPEAAVLLSERWQPVPGAPDLEVFPFETRPNLLSCNTYVLRGRDVLLVLDPGADRRQITRVGQVVNDALRQRPRPVLVLLTHCHRDHVREVRSLESSTPPWVLAHETAARALAQGDRALTMAEIYDEDAPRCEVHVPLFPTGAASAVLRPFALGHGHSLTVTPIPGNAALRAERLQVGTDFFLMYHVPGHSPDSVALRAGAVIFCGDLTVAARPLVAGAPGWDQPALIASLGGVVPLLRGGDLAVLAPGHGYSLSAAAAAMLERTLATVESLSNLESVDAERVRLLADYTRWLVAEAGDALAVIAGRLETAAFHLEALDERAAAAEALRALDPRAVDAALDSFSEHLAAVLDGRSLPLSLPHKGMAVILRLDGVLSEPALATYVSPLLLRRTRRMIADFVHTLYGMRRPDALRPASVHDILTEAQNLARSGGRAEGDLDGSLEDERAFARALGRRILQQPAAADVAFENLIPADLPAVYVEADRIVEQMTTLIEILAAQGVAGLRFDATAHSGRVILSVRSEPPSAAADLEIRHVRFFDAVLRPQGGSCRREKDAIRFDLPAAESPTRA